MRATGPAQPVEFLFDVLDVLAEFQIPYAVVGALAVSYYGIPRATADADAVIWLDNSGKSTREIANKIAGAGYRVELRQGDVDDPIAQLIQINDEHGNEVDLLHGVRGMDPAATGRCVNASLQGGSIRILAVEDLIAMKAFAGGPQDLQDVRGILQVSGQVLNSTLLKSLAAHFGADVVRALDDLLKEANL
jgi:hypothetical protein